MDWENQCDCVNLQPTTSSLPPYQTKQKTPNCKIRFSKTKIQKQHPQKTELNSFSYLTPWLWASPKFSPPVLSSSNSSHDCLLTAIAKRCEIEPPPHTPMRRNGRIFHSPTIASAGRGRARMRGRHYRCRTSKTEETTNLPHPLSNSNTYPLPILPS